MKKLMNYMFTVILIVLFSATGCFLDSGDDEDKTPASPTGTGKLVVNATYNGTAKTTGTGKIFVYVFSVLDTPRSTRVYEGSTDSEVTIGTEYPITISNMAAGSYYVLIFYDFKQHTTYVEGSTDKYILYKDTPCAASAAPVTITEGNTTTLDSVSFDATYEFGDGAIYVQPELAVKVTYKGTAKDTGTGKIYVYLYSVLTNAQTTPDYFTSTPFEATVNTEYTLTFPDITAANYYVLIFYDYKLHNTYVAGNTDRFELYDNTGSAASASQVTVTDGLTNTITGIEFDDTYLLGSSGAYQ